MVARLASARTNQSPTDRDDRPDAGQEPRVSMSYLMYRGGRHLQRQRGAMGTAARNPNIPYSCGVVMEHAVELILVRHGHKAKLVRPNGTGQTLETNSNVARYHLS